MTQQTPPGIQIITHLDSDRFPILHAASHDCEFPLSDLDIENIERMDSVMRELGDEAIGLAGVQIGYPKNIFILRINGENRVFINPEIMAKSREKRRRIEGCLSLPGVIVRTKRPKEVTLGYFDLNGDPQVTRFTGTLAQAACHEISHLRGRLVLNDTETSEEPNKSSFGMKLTPHRRKAIARRRAKKKRKK